MSRLQQLHDLLLDRTKWPDDFVWDYSITTSCAIGLACKAGIINNDPNYVCGREFGINALAAHNVFFTPRYGSYEHVTPEIVAMRIADIM